MMKRYDFCPGNGSRYDIVYGKVQDGGYLLVWLRRGGSGGCAFRFDGDGYVHSSYLAEKLGLESWMADVYALCAFLNTQGHTAEVAGNFDKHGQYIRPNRVELGGA